jgi:hypothetical protein
MSSNYCFTKKPIIIFLLLKKETFMENNALLKERVTAGGKTYYIDLKPTSDNRKYIRITEKRTNKDGSTEYSSVLLFEDHFYTFLDSFIKVIDEAGPRGKSSLEELKEIYPNAYEPWTAEDDKKLTALFRKGKTTADLTKIFGRQPGAIEARINKLGLADKVA